MARKKTADIVAELAASIEAKPRGSRPWWERVELQHQELLEEIHAAWYRGDLGTRQITAAKQISRLLSTCGITIGEQGVIAWLKRPPKSSSG